MTSIYDTDVLVVGAGPTGLTLAASLIARGIATTVVDRQAAGANTSRAAVVNARTPRGARDLDVARRLVKEGMQAPLFTIRDRARRLVPIDFSALPTAYPYSLMVPQSTTERLLLERLIELGGTVLRPKTLDRDRTGRRRCHRDRSTTATSSGRDTRSAPTACTASCASRRASASTAAHTRESFVLADVHLTGEAPARRGHPVLGDGGTHRGRAPARRHLPHRRSSRRRTRKPLCAFRSADSRHPRAGQGPDRRHRCHLGFALPHPSPGRRHVPRRAGCCLQAMPRTCTVPPAARA